VEPLRLDHVIIHVTDWPSTVAFYRSVVGAEPVPNEEGAANPLGSWAFRLGDQQINVHGPWPGREPGSCCPPPLNQPGSADLCFEWPGTVDSATAHLVKQGVRVAEGPIRRFGSRGWGTSFYVLDPSGNNIELICYED
jgi:catechol 2,3-dioxygenase-like lactoylglutathione lyase family enzyme